MTCSTSVAGAVPSLPLVSKRDFTESTNAKGVAPLKLEAPKVSVSLEDRPVFKVYDRPVHLVDGGKLKAGVWFHGVRNNTQGEPVPFDSWISSPLHIEAQTHDQQGNNFGRLVRFTSTVGIERTWALPMEMLSGDGSEMRAILLSMGVQIDPKNKNLFANYLQAVPPETVVTCVSSIGWHGANYVLPDTVYGDEPERLIFQSSSPNEGTFMQAGSVDAWRDEIGILGVGNPTLALSLSVGFAGALLGLCHGESGGVHFVGDSSTGKSTALEAARSIWGDEKSISSWKATANGMEGAASLRNDSLLCLDEISEASPREVGAIIYSLGNGVGKQRASRSGAARAPVRWRCMVLSTGERTIETTMLEAGERTKAGQSVRLLDVPVSRAHGAWDELHGYENGQALSDHIKQAAKASYGVVGRAFVQRLTEEKRPLSTLLETIKEELTPAEASSQERRAAARFAVIALAGQLAGEYGLTGWGRGYAIQAAQACFQAWREHRGQGNDETQKIISQVEAFIDAHGDSRFSHEKHGFAVPNRAGWFTEEDGGRVYWFSAGAFREAVAGFDVKRALDVLEARGMLKTRPGIRERAIQKRFGGRNTKYYPVYSSPIEGDA